MEYDILVNKKHVLKKTDIPDNLVFVPSLSEHLDSNHEIYLELKTWEQFKKMNQNSPMKMYIASGYRSFEYQQIILDYYLSKKGDDCYSFVALPGTSEHQTGLSFDFGFIDPETGLTAEYEVNEYKAFDWILENAHLYGFILRYPKGKEKITGYQYEPWHLRYVGLEIASKMYETKETLEEYTERIKKREKYCVKRI